MLLNHVGIVSSSEEKSDRFFQGVLGLEKTKTSELSAELSARLFDINEGCKLVYYGNEALLFEVFLLGRSDFGGKKVDHVCLEVTDRGEFLAKCAVNGVTVLEVPKGDSVVVFIEDYDGNLFEIKQKQ